jgi:hypothetical protein
MIAVTADLVALSERGLQTATGAVTAALAVDAHERRGARACMAVHEPS